MTAGLMRAQAVPAMVLSYLSIVWGIALGVVMFNEHPNLSSIAGSLLICSCTLILSVHEVRKPAGLDIPLVAQGDVEAAAPLLADEAAAAAEAEKAMGSKSAVKTASIDYTWQAEH